MIRKLLIWTLLAFSAVLYAALPSAAQDGKKPNILVIWGDDIGMWNAGAH